MFRKLEIGLIAVVAAVVVGNLQGKEPEKEHPLRAYFKKEGSGVAAMPFLKTEMVQKELGLTDAQKEKTAHLQEKVRNYLNSHEEQLAKGLNDFNAEIMKELESILEPRQIDRLLEITIQADLPMELFDNGTVISKLLDWTDDQKEKLKVISEDTQESINKVSVTFNVLPTNDKDVMKKRNNEFLKKLKPIMKEANDKIQAILTPKQHDMLDNMKGKEADMEKLWEEY